MSADPPALAMVAVEPPGMFDWLPFPPVVIFWSIVLLSIRRVIALRRR